MTTSSRSNRHRQQVSVPSRRPILGALVTTTLAAIAAIATGILPALELPW